ncbi:MAG: flagellar basal-body rod protein FlgF [Candidatus Eremiobacteraeota bacterium]|nr:flagellar basal-body rod protein FlgF [Candidatus Eremiobacteraeota bacterium]
MLDGMKMAAQGMIASMAHQDIIANNLANVGTAGFRKEKFTVSSFTDVLNKELANVNPTQAQGFIQAGGGIDTVGMLFHSSSTSYAQGALKQTGNSFDLALDDNGKGFFTVQTPDGIRYTRNGSFRLSTTGHIITADGSFLLGHNGPIRVQGSNFEVNNEGVVSVDGKEIDRLLITTFDDQKSLVKEGDSNFIAKSGGKVETNARVLQGYLEMANVNAIREMVDMITVMRAYEANQQVLKAQNKMLGKATNEIGRVR